MKKPFWVSFVMHPRVGFELHSPWWRSGYTPGDEAIVCAAVMATDEDDAKREIIAAHDTHVSLEWRFIEEKPKGWTPFNSRFKASAWMQWPGRCEDCGLHPAEPTWSNTTGCGCPPL